MVKPKKHLGQHFLTDENVAKSIVDALTPGDKYSEVLEVGPGMGVLTKYLLKNQQFATYAIDIDSESIEYLKANFLQLENRIIEGDFLQLNFDKYFSGQFAVIGNFPYNISSQILFKVLEIKEKVPEVVGMFQKEVAERIASKPGKKAYGILSVFMQAYYDVDYLFTVDENLFNPPPKVKSGVIRCRRKENLILDCDEKSFIRVVKTGFNQRRKTLRNSLKSIIPEGKDVPFLNQRPEELSWEEFVVLTNAIFSNPDFFGTK